MTKKLYSFIVAMTIFIFWLITFVCINFNVKNEAIGIIENIQLICIGFFVLFLLNKNKGTFYILPILCYVPFMFSHGFDAISIPIGLYIALFLLLIGAIINYIKFKVKLDFKNTKLLLGIGVFLISLVFGGVFNFDNKYLLFQILFCLIIGFMFFIGFVFLTSTSKKIDFKNIAFIMTYLALILMLEETTYYIFNPNLLIKAVNVGWGVNNNIGLCLLFTIPFAAYLSIVIKTSKRYIYLLFSYIEFIYIIFTYSRGSIFIGLIGIIFIFIMGLLYFKKEKLIKKYLLINAIYLLVSIMLFTFLSLMVDGFANSFYNLVFKGVNIQTFNGRFNIYKDYISLSKNHLIFGHGLLYPLVHHVDVKIDGYQWGHCTYIHTLFTLGIVGVIAISYHFFEKYYGLIKKINLEKIILLLAFLLSGLYGMIDVSYFFINYMMVFIVCIILSNDYFEKIDFRRKI